MLAPGEPFQKKTEGSYRTNLGRVCVMPIALSATSSDQATSPVLGNASDPSSNQSRLVLLLLLPDLTNGVCLRHQMQVPRCHANGQ